MSSRRHFLEGAALAAAAASAVTAATSTLASAASRPPTVKPTVTPRPSATPSPAPSPLARALAASLQKDLPQARLSDAMTEKIAADINDNFAIGKAFRKRKQHDLPAPDFIFSASESDDQ